MKDWQHGYELAALKGVAGVFRKHDTGLVFSQFGGVNEAKVAEWLAAGRLQRKGAAVAAVQILERPLVLKDFREEVVAELPAGSAWVPRFACTPGGAADLRALLAALCKERVTACECWQEHAVDRQVVESLELRWAGTKIKASSELRGLWVSSLEACRPALPAAERLSLAKLRLQLKTAPLAERLKRAGLGWVDHYSSYNVRHTWSALALRGYGGREDFIIKPSEMVRKWRDQNPEKLKWQLKDTPLRAKLPEVEPLLAALPGRPHRIRLMRLAPGGGELKRHADITDPDAGVEPGQLMRLHLPIATNPGVQFESWDLMGTRQRAHMAEGEAWYLDTRKPHTAKNVGQSDRVHLVVDIEASPALLKLVA